MQAHEFSELAEYLKDAGYPEDWVNDRLIESIPYYAANFSIVELMEYKEDQAIIKMDFDISKGSIQLDSLTAHLLTERITKSQLAEFTEPFWKDKRVAESVNYDDLAPASYVFHTLSAFRELTKDHPDLIYKKEEMNRNSLEDFRAEAKALKVPAEMVTKAEELMEKGVPYIQVSGKLPSRKGYLEATMHVKQSGQSDYYFLNKYDLALSKAKPIDEGKQYFILSTKEDGKPLIKKFDSPIQAVENFKKREGDAELAIGIPDAKNMGFRLTVATMKDGKVDYVNRELGANYAEPLKNTVYVNKGMGFNMKQAGNMLQEGAAHRDDLVSRQGVKYEAWNIYKFDEPRDNYGNLKIKQYGEGYPFKLETQLKEYNIKDLEDPKKFAEIVTNMKDGERQLVTAVAADGKAQKVEIEAVPRYGNINFFDQKGKPQMREAYLKEGKEKENIFSKKLEKDKQKGQEAGLSM